MSWARREFPAAGIIAMFDEPNQIGDVLDLDAPRNAPAKNPTAHLDKIYFHSALDLLEVATAATVTINHPSVAAGTGPSGDSETNTVFQWGGVTNDYLLLNIASLGLSAAPFVLVATGDNIIWPGMPVQALSGGRSRWVTVYATTTQVRLFETASRTGVSIPAISLPYTVLVFRDPPGDLTEDLKSFDPDTGDYQMGFGRFSSLRHYLQVAPGGSPFWLADGRTIDLKNGAPRALRGDGTFFDPVPSGARSRITPGTGTYGSSMAYDGSFTGSPGVLVQAP